MFFKSPARKNRDKPGPTSTRAPTNASESRPGRSQPVVYIAGLGRSGSTLLERLLVEGSTDWWSVGELVHLWDRGVRDNELCGCGEPFHDCSIWTAVGQRAFGGWNAIDVHEVISLQSRVARDRFIPYLLAPSLNKAFRARTLHYVGLVRKVYQAVRDVTGATFVVDSSKHVSAALSLRLDPEMDLKLIHLVRDSRAVAYSWSKTVPRPATGGETMMTKWSPLEVSIRYVAYNTLLTGAFRTRRKEVRYEDYVEFPATNLEAIRRWVNGSGSASLNYLTDQVADLSTSHGISGNPVRFKAGPVPLKLDNAWRDRMSSADCYLVTALTLPSLLQFGYQISPRKPSRRGGS